ncbi:MAG: dTMP kinase [Parachlamydiaceae bacterium]|nr:dTMP kinase [Parachlamydiaceae bacterium]
MKIANQPHPRFITFEGGEGAGKTTLMNYLQNQLEFWGYSVTRTREPGGTLLGEQIRNLLLSHIDMPICGKSELYLFLAVRAQHIEEVIAPALSRGKIVMCDRFNDSTIAYQGVGRGLGIEYVKEICLSACGDILPDLTLYLDVDPIEGLARTKRTHKENAASGNVDRIEAEQLQFHRDVRQAFIDLSKAEPERLFIIDANQIQSKVFATAKKMLEAKFRID